MEEKTGLGDADLQSCEAERIRVLSSDVRSRARFRISAYLPLFWAMLPEPPQRYFQRQLAYARPRSPGEEKVEERLLQLHGEWMEANAQAWKARQGEEELSEGQLLDWVRAGYDGQGKAMPVLVLLGEPGIGKTLWMTQVAALLAHELLFPRWDREPPERQLWPLLLRCRNLTLRGREAEEAFRKGADPLAPLLTPGTPRSLLSGSNALLVDGLDELPVGREGLDAFSQALSRHGAGRLLILSCRTAIWNGDVGAAIREHHPDLTVCRLRGFDPPTQAAYVRHHLPSREDTAHDLIGQLESNLQLRSLAPNPLMLRLMVGLVAKGRVKLPLSRADFYTQAIRQAWHDALSEKPLTYSEAGVPQTARLSGEDIVRLGHKRDAFLTELAQHLYSQSEGELRVLADLEDLDGLFERVPSLKAEERAQAQLRAALVQSGLLVPNQEEGAYHYHFLHTTFQEYYLARAWLAGPTPSASGDSQSRQDRLTHALLTH